MRISSVAVALAALLAVPAAARAAEHPRLAYSAADVAMLRARAQGTHGYIRNSLKIGADEFLGSRISSSGVVSWSGGRTFNVGDRRDVGNALMVWAFVWQLEGSQPYLDLARNWLLDVTSWSTFDLDGEHDLLQAHLLTGAAFAYDVLHPQLTESQRAQVRKAIARDAASLSAFGDAGAWWESDYFQNHNWVNHAAIGLAALALEGEWDAAATAAWLADATRNARGIQAACSRLEDGTWHEGFAYLSYGFNWHLPFVDALKRSGREDLTSLGLLRGLGKARAHAQLPEQPNAPVLANGDFIGFPKDDQLAALRFAASRYGDGLAQVAADRWAAGAPRFTYGPEINHQIFEFLYYDPAAPAADLSAEPLDWFGTDMEAVVFRSGWDKGSVLFAMKSGAYGGRTVWENILAGTPSFSRVNFSHDHADDMGFYLYGNGSWLAPEASGYYIGHADSPGPQANRTEFHNSILIDGQGQLGEGVRGSSDWTSSYAWYPQRSGSIPLHVSTAHHAYAVAEGAKLYPPALGLTRFDRHVLFLDRRFVVVRDLLAASAPRDFDWSIHFLDGAAREGSWVKGAGKNGQVLGVAVVSPAAFTYASTTQAPAKIDKLDPDASVTAVTVSPTAPAADVTFLTALVPTTAAGWASRPQVQALDAAQPGAGLEIVEPDRTSRAIFGPAAGGLRSAGGLGLDGVAGAVSYAGGAPVRAALVQGRSLSDQGGRAILKVEGTSDALEADGLASDLVVLTGQLDGTVVVFAPRATRAFLNGREVSLARLGDTVRLNGATSAEPAPAGSDPGTAPSAPVLGGGTATDAAPPAPDVVLPAPAVPAGPATPAAATPEAPAAPGSPTIGPGESTVELVAQHGGCAGAGAGKSTLALLGLVSVIARLVRRGARRRERREEPAAAEGERRRDAA